MSINSDFLEQPEFFIHSLLESFNSGKHFLKRKRMDRIEAFFEVNLKSFVKDLANSK